MKKREVRARQVVRAAIEEVMRLGYHLHVPVREPAARDPGVPVTRVEQLNFIPVPEEYKRREKVKRKTKVQDTEV